MAKHFLNFMKNTLNQQIKNAQENPKHDKCKENIPQHMILTTKNPSIEARGTNGHISHHGTKK